MTEAVTSEPIRVRVKQNDDYPAGHLYYSVNCIKEKHSTAASMEALLALSLVAGSKG